MLRLRRGRLTWDAGDVLAMSRVLDADQSVKRTMPLVPSVIQLAERNNVQIDARSRFELNVWRTESANLTRLLDPKLQYSSSGPGPHLPHSFEACSDRLFNHQKAALHFMNPRWNGHRNFLLADQVGVGKTAVALMYVRSLTTVESRVLVIAMNSAKRQWRREIRRWVPGRAVELVEGTIAEQRMRIDLARYGFVVGHWESLVNCDEAYLDQSWDAVILDEAHLIGNRETMRAQIAHRLTTKVKLALTAHPYANGPHELWSILHFLYPETYSSYWRFFAQHVAASPKPFGGFEIIGVRRPKLLKRELAPFVVQRTKQQVRPSMPNVTRIPVEVELTDRGRREYDKLRKQFFVELDRLDGHKKALAIPSVLARITRIRQYLIDPGLLGAKEPSAKFPAVLEVLDSVGAPIVIFTLFQKAIPRLTSVLRKAGHRCAAIDGTVKSVDREKARRAFLNGKLSALLVTAGAGGLSLNLGKWGNVLHLDLPWTARDFEQTEGRVDRPEEGTGTIVPTTSYRVVVSGSYEERMEEKLEQKQKMFADVFTVADLKKLFA